MIDAMNFLHSRSIGEEIAIFCGWGSPPLHAYVSTIRKSTANPDSVGRETDVHAAMPQALEVSAKCR
jgi:hypothetical protein